MQLFLALLRLRPARSGKSCHGKPLRHVDAVYLVLPNHLHREYTVRAAHAGVHVLCEKPMAVTAEDCKAMIEAADASHAKLMIAYRLHFEQGNLEAILLAESGRLGNLRIFTSTFAQQVDRDNIRVREKVENGGGPVYDLGVYCINAARYLFQDEPTKVFATTANNGEPRFSHTEEMTTMPRPPLDVTRWLEQRGGWRRIRPMNIQKPSTLALPQMKKLRDVYSPSAISSQQNWSIFPTASRIPGNPNPQGPKA
jgi:hypothetical protein